jgi:hypothetical protein
MINNNWFYISKQLVERKEVKNVEGYRYSICPDLILTYCMHVLKYHTVLHKYYVSIKKKKKFIKT